MKSNHRERFSLALEWEPRCPRLADEGDRVTWATLRIVVDGHVVTRHLAGGERHDGVLGPAAPVAAWIARHWAALVGEERLPVGRRVGDAHELLATIEDAGWDAHEEAIDDWLEAHALRRVRGGLLLPDLVFWRRGDMFTLSWRADPEPRTARAVRFLESGTAHLPAEMVVEALRDFVLHVLERVESGPATSAIRQELVEFGSALRGPGTARFHVLAARLGRNPASLLAWLDDAVRDPGTAARRIADAYLLDVDALEVPETLDSPVAMAARSASPEWSEDDHARLLELARTLTERSAAHALARLARRVHTPARPGEEDHELGYRRAARVRRTLGNEAGPLHVEELLRTRGCAVLDIGLDDTETDAVALWDRESRALVAVNSNSPRAVTPWGRRAVLAHELYHLLYDATDRRFFGECLNDWAPTVSERTANAFAAELLLPRAALPDTRNLDTSEVEDLVADLCESFEVGRELATWQLVNRVGLARAVGRALLAPPRRGRGA